MKNYCRHCGAKLEVDKKHYCPKLLAWTQIYDDSEELEGDCYERGKDIIPDCVAPEEGEIVVKQYKLAILRTRHKLTRAEGKMQITNKRVIFRAAGRNPVGKTVYQSDFAIDKIDGVEIRRDYRFLFWDFFLNTYLSSICCLIGILLGGGMFNDEKMFFAVLSLIVASVTAIPFFALKKRYLFKLLALSFGYGITGSLIVQAEENSRNGFLIICAIVFAFLAILYLISMFLSFFKPNLVIEVKTSSGSPGIQIKHKFASLFVWKKMDENSGFSEILPWEDADLATKEISAIINDIKTLGDMGVDKWKE